MPNPLTRKTAPGGVRKDIADAKQQAIDDANQQAIDIAHRFFGGGNHGASPSTPARLDTIVLGNHDINFEDAPVGGWSSLSLWPDGRYQFSGHLHDSGFPSYDYGVVWLLAGSAGTAFVFKHQGHLHGDLPGSRDDDWSDSDTNQAIADGWNELSAAYRWKLSAEVDADLGELVDATAKAVGNVAKVVEVASA